MHRKLNLFDNRIRKESPESNTCIKQVFVILHHFVTLNSFISAQKLLNSYIPNLKLEYKFMLFKIISVNYSIIVEYQQDTKLKV